MPQTYDVADFMHHDDLEIKTMNAIEQRSEVEQGDSQRARQTDQSQNVSTV